MRLHANGIEHDADLAGDAALPLDARHARNGKQALGDRIVDVPAQLLERHVGRFG
jgi:hypothetical protein